MDAILEKVFAEQSRDVEYDRSRLKQLKEIVKDNDFGMVIDGMNISHKGRKAGFDKRIVSWLLDIAGFYSRGGQMPNAKLQLLVYWVGWGQLQREPEDGKCG